MGEGADTSLQEIPGYKELSGALQAYANAALLSYTTELYKSHAAWLVDSNRSDAGGASGAQVNGSGSGAPVVSTNASYVFCPEAVGTLSESLRQWSSTQGRHHHHRARNGNASSSSGSSNGSVSGPAGRAREVGRPFLRATNRSLHANASASSVEREGEGARQHQVVSLSHSHGSPYGADAVAVASGDTPYLLLLAPAVSVDGVTHISPKWDQAAGGGARGRPASAYAGAGPEGGEGHPASAGWVEIGCQVAHIRHLASIDVSAS